VNAKTFKSKLEHSESLAFNPGGVQEVLMMDPSRPNDILLFLNTRKGFINIALQHGAPIVPVFIFNYGGSYVWYSSVKKFLAEFWQKVGCVHIFFTGKFGIPFFIPKPKKCMLYAENQLKFQKYPELTKKNFKQL
jgi:1-acyl-sn-glycerol-3-phosphate acyltransferase